MFGNTVSSLEKRFERATISSRILATDSDLKSSQEASSRRQTLSADPAWSKAVRRKTKGRYPRYGD